MHLFPILHPGKGVICETLNEDCFLNNGMLE